jgi:hypothetical protein
MPSRRSPTRRGEILKAIVVWQEDFLGEGGPPALHRGERDILVCLRDPTPQVAFDRRASRCLGPSGVAELVPARSQPLHAHHEAHRNPQRAANRSALAADRGTG